MVDDKHIDDGHTSLYMMIHEIHIRELQFGFGLMGQLEEHCAGISEVRALVSVQTFLATTLTALKTARIIRIRSLIAIFWADSADGIKK